MVINLLNGPKLTIFKLTDENRQYAKKIPLEIYLGEHCKYCYKKFTTLEELKTVVYAGYHKYGRIACWSCWDENNL